MNTIRTLLILLAAAILTAACIDSHPKTPTLNTTDRNITAEEFVYGGHQWIAFFYHFDTRQLFEVKHNPDCPCHKAADNAKDGEAYDDGDGPLRQDSVVGASPISVR